MLDSDIIKKLQQYSNDANSMYAYIAQYFIENMDTVGEEKIDVIAKKCLTSPASIVRFCNKLGLAGFNELKYRLGSLKESFKIIGNQFFSINNIQTDISSFLHDYVEMKSKSSYYVQDYVANYNLNPVLEKFRIARNVYIFAMNLSFNVSRNFAQRLRWIDYVVYHECDFNSIESYLPMIKPNDIVILISLSGDSELIIKIANMINSKVYKMSIQCKNGELNKCVDAPFILNSDENNLWNVYSIRSQMVIQLLDFLYAYLIRNRQNICE